MDGKALERCTVRVDAEPRPLAHGRVLRVLPWVLATAGLATLLFLLPGRTSVPPRIEADYAYTFLAADRMYAGLAPTAMPPKAPFQPWTWRCDWTFLTQWPVGYPVLICAARLVTGLPSAQAGVALGVVSCALAVVAWFAWARICLGKKWPAVLIACLVGVSSFSMENLIHPASDTVLLALAPIVMLLALRALGHGGAAGEIDRTSSTVRMLLLGFAAGLLFWIRYAAVFVTVAIGGFLIFEWLLMRRARPRHVIAYAMAATVPIAALVVLNGVMGQGGSTQEQLNLGQKVSWAFSPEMCRTAWLLFTEQTLYAYRPEAGWLFQGILPVAGMSIPLLFKSSRQAMKAWLRSPAILLSGVMVVGLLGFLIAASTLFQGKYDYVGLDRYYQPVRPLYFVLFVGPLVTLRSRALRVLACVPILLAVSWFINQDARRTLARWGDDGRASTDYGRWACKFEPNSRALYAWLRTQAGNDLVVLSNFHDDIALETWIPACPTPQSPQELATWLERIRRARRTVALRVLFVLDPDNHTREYYLPPPEDVVARFDLVHPPGLPSEVQPYVFVPRRDPTGIATTFLRERHHSGSSGGAVEIPGSRSSIPHAD